jgi:hypothetical protein
MLGKGKLMASEVMSGIEKRKVTIDILKHLTTLSTGAIVILVTFLSGNISSLSGKSFVAIALIAFLASILCAFYSILILLGNIQDLVKIKGSVQHNFLRISLVGTICGFSGGIIFLMIFIFTNFA